MDVKWLVGGACAAFGVGILLYAFSSTPEKALSREELAAALREVRKARAPSLIAMASIAVSLRNVDDTQKRSKRPFLAQDLLKAQTSARAELKHAEFIVYQRLAVTESQVKAAEEEYRSDPEIAQIVEEMRTELENACQGLPPKSEYGLPVQAARQSLSGENCFVQKTHTKERRLNSLFGEDLILAPGSV